MHNPENKWCSQQATDAATGQTKQRPDTMSKQPTTKLYHIAHILHLINKCPVLTLRRMSSGPSVHKRKFVNCQLHHSSGFGLSSGCLSG